MRVAAVDIGTNSVLLLVAERSPKGVLRAVDERATITRLGQGVDKARRLAPEAVDRTNACLTEYAAAAKAAGAQRMAVVGTSAMRDADGGAAVREHVLRVFGVEARVLSGEDEARVTFAGALSGLPPSPDGAPVAVFDVGGGSTEIVVGVPGQAPTYARSFDVGSVRLTERHVASDPPTESELRAIRDDVRATLKDLPRLGSDGAFSGAPVGIAGTVTTLVAAALRLPAYDGTRVHGHDLTLADLRRLTRELASMSLRERQGRAGIEPKRADVLVAGAVLVEELLEHLGASALRASDRGVRWGLAEALLAERTGTG